MNIKNSLTVFSDGGSRGNPGQAACGFVIYKDGKKLISSGKYLGHQTNNYAEYMGVITALSWIRENLDISTLSQISCLMDSQLVAQQLNGNWKVKHENIRNLFFTIKELEKKIHVPILFASVPRSQNQEADSVVNVTLDTHLT